MYERGESDAQANFYVFPALQHAECYGGANQARTIYHGRNKDQKTSLGLSVPALQLFSEI